LTKRQPFLRCERKNMKKFFLKNLGGRDHPELATTTDSRS
jgi:hypothetical protein